MLAAKFVLTGGPGGGKSESKQMLEKTLSKLGYRLLFVPETATQLMQEGFGPLDIGNEPFQQAQLTLQAAKEIAYEKLAETLDLPVVMICDRGLLDGKAYCDHQFFDRILEEEILPHTPYDGVFHMQTSAATNPDLYSKKNNPYRYTSALDAVKQDNELLEIYKDHSVHIVIPASMDPAAKQKALCAAITEQLETMKSADPDFPKRKEFAWKTEQSAD